MSLPDYSAVLESIVQSLTAALPDRYIEDSLVPPALLPIEQLMAGTVCVVSKGGGDFANYRGREGDLGKIDVALVCFVQVPENSKPVDVQTAELTLLGELLQWVATTAVPGLDVIYPENWFQSKQTEHPAGWLTLNLTVKP
jgi:hypothetical protein